MTHSATTICPSNHHIQSIHTWYYHIYTTEFGKNNDIIKGDRDNNEEDLHYENRFQALR